MSTVDNKPVPVFKHHRQSSPIFGTDGVRGKANIYPMSPDLVLRLGQAIGYYFRRQTSSPRILIGKDTRLSGYMLEQSLCAGILSVGADALFLGPLPTPGIAYMTRGMRASAGIVISASHNAFQDNGIKIFNHDGYKLPDAVEATLDHMVHSETLTSELPVAAGIGTARRIDDAIGQYAVFLKEQFPKRLTLDGLRIVIDCAHGAAYRVAPKVFRELGAEVFLIGDQPNGTNINDRCGALYPEALRAEVLLYKADLGIALDGDGDRLIMIDDSGAYIDGDVIMGICARYMIDKGTLHNNTVVATVMSNAGLERSLATVGGKLLRVKVGDRYVVEAMCRGDYNFGGEQSGHIIHRGCATTGDGILAALKVIEIALSRERKLSELKTDVTLLPQVRKNLPVARKVPADELVEFSKLLQASQQRLRDRGRVLFRYSGTEDKARIMVEGEDYDEIEKIAHDLVAVMQADMRGLLPIPRVLE